MADKLYYISSYDLDIRPENYQLFLLCMSSEEDLKVLEWIQISGPTYGGGAIYSQDSFLLEGEYKSLLENKKMIHALIFDYVKNRLASMYDIICDFSKQFPTLELECRSRYFNRVDSKVYINVGEEIYINPRADYEYLQIEHDICDSLSAGSILDPLNLFWRIGKYPKLFIEYGTDLRFIESKIGIRYDLDKHIHISENGRYLSVNSGKTLLYAIYGLFSSIVNVVFEYYYYNQFYENGKRLL